MRPPGWETAEITEFGDGPELSAWLISLIVAGKKTATCGALRDYLAEQEPLPQPGQRCLVKDHLGRAAAGIEVTEVTQRRFADVPEDFALAEGEGDFADWERGHRAYFQRNGGWSPDLMLVCERFRLIEVFDPPPPLPDPEGT